MNLIIIDDDPFVTGALKILLEANPNITVLASGSNGKEAVSLYRRHRPDILLMDIRMEEMDGLTASEQILQEYPDAKILLLTTFSDDEYIIKALLLGAKGYLLKQDYATIVPALEAVASGQTVFGNEIISRIPSLMQQKESFDYHSLDINDRELEIIRLIAEGLSNKEIASALFLSEGTVRNYLSSILDKLHLRDRTQVAVFYYKHS
ncbi:DNA-binding response regulator [Mediterraneibacter butyricigenes]|uniref:Stage 0 sporulation protein A homolog n=1 Tax=Mediterraneibacter butyricigenes TaxID=2316025 RepID=A0A391P344_9FIRM|nr:response regulator transcription factor [Mediterraneibacter butyricigenes]RGO24212.1 DNA-binding response regulator [Dorea sp. OM02-2LB]GCA68181.1 DNA-binding response regulator [Mediterraneibacter butyricigenes]